MASSSFDAVVSQFGLMFLEDIPAALHEMLRVLKPGGRLAVAVWDSLDRSPGYAALMHLLDTLFGDQVARALRAPFVLGERELLRSLLSEAGLADAQVETQRGTARFPSIASWMQADVRGWTLADRLDDGQFERLLGDAERVLRPFTLDDGKVVFDVSAHVVTAVKA